MEYLIKFDGTDYLIFKKNGGAIAGRFKDAATAQYRAAVMNQQFTEQMNRTKKAVEELEAQRTDKPQDIPNPPPGQGVSF